MRDKAVTYCLRLIQKRRRTAKEIWQSLLKFELSDEERREIVEYLTSLGLINDRSYAEAWIHDRDLLAPRSVRVLKQELLLKGVDCNIISEVLSNKDPEDELIAAQLLLKKKSSLYNGLNEDVAQRRKMALLARRGFSYDVIRRIINE